MNFKKILQWGKNKKLHFGFHIYRVGEEKNLMKKLKDKTNKTGKLNKYIHIGYPKSGSTVLQNGFFGKHPEVLNLGCGNRDDQSYWDDLGYISKDINIAMEVDLRYRNSISYKPDEVKSKFEKYFTIARDSAHVKTVGISNENYAFQWNYGIDIEEKARRLSEIFGADTKIIVILREQIDLLTSLYKEQIRFGYSGSINDFFDYLWDYQDRSSLYEFCFDKVIGVYEKYFSKENIVILPFELFRNDSETFLKKLSKSLNVQNDLITKVDKVYNMQLSAEELEIKRRMNEKYKHTFEKGFYQVFDNHRYIPYYTEEIGRDVPFDVYLDYHVRHKLVQAAKKIATIKNVGKIDLEINEKNKKRFSHLFRDSNQKLTQSYNIDLEKYNYL